MKQYVIWNPEKIANNNGNADTYAELLAFEKETNCSWSSIVYTDNIISVVNAISYEFDATAMYEEIN